MTIRWFKQRKRVAEICIASLLLPLAMPTQAYGALNAAPAVKAAAGYSDVSDSYAAKEIAALSAAGILNGFEDGTFRPLESVNRAQFAKVMAAALKLEPNAQQASHFADIPQDAWYAGYVGALVNEGITEGTEADQFSPDKSVSREELAVFFVRSMKLEATAKTVAQKNDAFADFEDISDWAKPAVTLAQAIGFLQGQENGQGQLLFTPKASAERQALARLAFEFVEHKDSYADKAKMLSGSPTSTPTASASPSPSPSTGVFGGGGSFGGGGGGGNPTATPTPSSSATPAPSAPADGSTISSLSAGAYTGSFTVAKGVSAIGPASGTAVISGKLTIDPGADGSVTLHNIKAADLTVLSGADHSIRLDHVTVTGTLEVQTAAQTAPVRIVSGEEVSITGTVVQSSAILETEASSTAPREGFGRVTIADTAAGAAITFRGLSASPVEVKAKNSRITVQEGAAIGNLLLQEAGAVVALNGTAASLQTASEAVQPKLEGTQIDKLKNSTLNTAIAAVRQLGDPAQLTWDKQEQVRQALRLSFGLTVFDSNLTLPAVEARLLDSAKSSMAQFAREAAEKVLAKAPRRFYYSDLEKALLWLDEALASVEVAKEWGIVPSSLHQFSAIEWTSSSIVNSYTYIRAGMHAGASIMIGQSAPGTSIQAEVYHNSEQSIGVLKAVADKDGFYVLSDKSLLPLSEGARVIIKATPVGKNTTYQAHYYVRKEERFPTAPLIQEPYFAGDPLIMLNNGLGNEYIFIVALNSKGEVIGKGFNQSYRESAVLSPDSTFYSVAGETVRLYAYNDKGIVSAPRTVKSKANMGQSESPAIPGKLYDGDFLLNITGPASSLVQLSRDNQPTVSVISNEYNYAVFDLSHQPLKEGEKLSVTLKEAGKETSLAVTAKVLGVSGQTDLPKGTVKQIDHYSVLDITAEPLSAIYYIQQINQDNNSPFSVTGFGYTNEQGIFQTGFQSNTDQFTVYAKAPGKAASAPQTIVVPSMTANPLWKGHVYSDSIYLGLWAQRQGTVALIKRGDGSELYRFEKNNNDTLWVLEEFSDKQLVHSGETVYITVQAPGKQESNPISLPVEFQDGTSGAPNAYGTLYKGMSNPLLMIDTQGRKGSIRLDSGDGKTDHLIVLGNSIVSLPVKPELMQGKELKLSFHEHGKEASLPVIIPIHDTVPVTALSTVTNSVYIADYEYDEISGTTEPLATVTLKHANMERGDLLDTVKADKLGRFTLSVRTNTGEVLGGDILEVRAQANGLLESKPILLTVKTAQGQSQAPSVTEQVYSSGSYVALQVKTAAGTIITIMDENYGDIYSVQATSASDQDVGNTLLLDLRVPDRFKPQGTIARSLKMWTQTPGQLKSETVTVQVYEPSIPSFTNLNMLNDKVDYMKQTAKITATGVEPYTQFWSQYGEHLLGIADSNGYVSFNMDARQGELLMVNQQAPGKLPVLGAIDYVPYIYYGTDDNSGEVNIGGGSGGGGMSMNNNATSQP